MRQAVLHGPRDLRLEEFVLDVDRLEALQLWVHTRVSALSTGTDRGNYEGAERVPGAPPYPRWVGYSNVGVVRGVGTGVTRFAVGDRVFATKPHVSDYVGCQDDMIVKVPDVVDDEDAAFTYLYHLGFHSLRRGHFEPGESVAVIGLGILGLATVELARQWGGQVIALGNDEGRLAKARQVGAHLALPSDDPDLVPALDAFTRGVGVDLVVLAANPWPAYRLGVKLLRENGRMAILSLPGRGEAALDFNPLALSWFYSKALTLISVNGRSPYRYPGETQRFSTERGCQYLLDLMAHRTLHPQSLITHRLPYERMVEAYDLADRREKAMVGVVFDWRP